MKRVTLKAGGDQPQRLKHPWVMKDVIEEKSFKSLKSGDPVTVLSDRGHFLGYGYANPLSEITIRILSFKEEESQFYSSEFLFQKVLFAAKNKFELNLTEFSYRLLYAESDGVPGLVIDRYVVKDENSKRHQVFIYQVTTAGIEQILMNPLDFFKTVADQLSANGISQIEWADTSVMARNDGNVRKKEGLEVAPPVVLRESLDLKCERKVLVRSVSESRGFVELNLNFLTSQKTGLFLDQTSNISKVVKLIQEGPASKAPALKILDVCSYVGHWSIQVASALKKKNEKFDLTMHLLDQSESALKLAKTSLQKFNVKTETFCQDALKPWNGLDQDYDIVIVDPPAFIKAVKDQGVGQHAYLKMSLEALARIKPGGIFVVCSCSAHLSEIDFFKIQRKALLRAEREAVLLERGGPTPDHTHSPFFDQAHYLKMLVYKLS